MFGFDSVSLSEGQIVVMYYACICIYGINMKGKIMIDVLNWFFEMFMRMEWLNRNGSEY